MEIPNNPAGTFNVSCAEEFGTGLNYTPTQAEVKFAGRAETQVAEPNVCMVSNETKPEYLAARASKA